MIGCVFGGLAILCGGPNAGAISSPSLSVPQARGVLSLSFHETSAVMRFLQRRFIVIISSIVILLLNGCSGLRLHNEELYQLSQSAEKTWSGYSSEPVIAQTLSNANAFSSLRDQLVDTQQEAIAFGEIKAVARRDWENLERETINKLLEYSKGYEDANESQIAQEDKLKELKCGLLRANKAVNGLQCKISQLEKEQTGQDLTKRIEELNKLINDIYQRLSGETKAEDKERKSLLNEEDRSKILEILRGSQEALKILEKFSKEEVLATRVILLRIYLDIAVAGRDRLQLEKEYYERRIRELKERKREWLEALKLVKFILNNRRPQYLENVLAQMQRPEILTEGDYGLNEVIPWKNIPGVKEIKEETEKPLIVEDLQNLAKSEEETDKKKLQNNLEVFLSFAFLLNHFDRTKELKEREDKFEDLWLEPLRMSQVNVSERQRFIADGLSGLTIYYKGGLTEEDIGLMVGLAEGITALTILKKE